MTPKLAEERGEQWPLAVESATILCGEKNRLILFVRDSSGAIEYALNGRAKDAGYPDLGVIWLENPDIPGAKLPMWLTAYGLEKCGF